MRDDLFGEIQYIYGWDGECTWYFLGRDVRTRLSVPSDEGEEISTIQREAFIAFEESKERLCRRADEAIFAYYQSLCPEYRERFGPQYADEWAPKISEASELSRLATPTGLLVQQSFSARPERIIGLLFDCIWDTSLGMAVKFVNEALREVGPQDIVL